MVAVVIVIVDGEHAGLADVLKWATIDGLNLWSTPIAGDLLSYFP